MDVVVSGDIISVSSSTHPLEVRNDPQDRSHCTAKLGVTKVAMDGDIIVRVQHSELHMPSVFLSSQEGVSSESAALMLSFMPDFESSVSCEAKKTLDEYVFLVDRSGSMGHGGYGKPTAIEQCRDALQLFLRSLPEGCLFNIVGFGSTYKKLFDESRLYDESSVAAATQYVSKMDSDMGGTEILKPLKAILGSSGSFSSYVSKAIGNLMSFADSPPAVSRKLFLLTDGAVGNTDDVIRVVKENAGSTRVFTFGVGEGAAVGLVRGVARAGRGESCFIRYGEPIDENVITQLGKAIQTTFDDVKIDWGRLKVVEQSPTQG